MHAMPNVLVSSDIVNCPHLPGAAANVSAVKLTVQGKPVLTGLGSVTGCSNVPPPPAKVPCTTVTIIGGKAAKLNVSGTSVLLASLAATAAGSPGGALSVVPGQVKLIAI